MTPEQTQFVIEQVVGQEGIISLEIDHDYIEDLPCTWEESSEGEGVVARLSKVKLEPEDWEYMNDCLKEGLTIRVDSLIVGGKSYRPLGGNVLGSSLGGEDILLVVSENEFADTLEEDYLVSFSWDGVSWTRHDGVPPQGPLQSTTDEVISAIINHPWVQVKDTDGTVYLLGDDCSREELLNVVYKFKRLTGERVVDVAAIARIRQEKEMWIVELGVLPTDLSLVQKDWETVVLWERIGSYRHKQGAVTKAVSLVGTNAVITESSNKIVVLSDTNREVATKLGLE